MQKVLNFPNNLKMGRGNELLKHLKTIENLTKCSLTFYNEFPLVLQAKVQYVFKLFFAEEKVKIGVLDVNMRLVCVA